MQPSPGLERHRVILAHFDSYSTALVFARWPNGSLLAPGPLPEGAVQIEAPAAAATTSDEDAEAASVLAATVARYGLNADELVVMPEFRHWHQGPDGPIRIHLLRFTCFEAPKALLAPQGAVFKPISELRGSAMAELVLLREVFNLIVSGGGRA